MAFTARAQMEQSASALLVGSGQALKDGTRALPLRYQEEIS